MKKDLDSCIEKLKVYYGINPYNKPNNLAYLDRYYYKSVSDSYDSDTLRMAEKEIQKMREVWKYKHRVTDKDIRKEAEASFLFHVISVHNIFI